MLGHRNTALLITTEFHPLSNRQAKRNTCSIITELWWLSGRKQFWMNYKSYALIFVVKYKNSVQTKWCYCSLVLGCESVCADVFLSPKMRYWKDVLGFFLEKIGKSCFKTFKNVRNGFELRNKIDQDSSKRKFDSHVRKRSNFWRIVGRERIILFPQPTTPGPLTALQGNILFWILEKLSLGKTFHQIQ